MPYIDKGLRKHWNPYLKNLLARLKEPLPDGSVAPGVLNYIVTRILLAAIGNKPSYARYNEIIGMLECCKLEMYRQRVGKYEDKKLKSNGDVY